MHPVLQILGGVTVAALYLLRLLKFRSGVPQSSDAAAHDPERWFADGIRTAARQLGVRFEARPQGARSAVGTVDHFTVEVEKTVEPVLRTDGSGTDLVEHLVASIRGGLIPERLVFTPERGASDDVLVGETLFDEIVHAQGPPAVVLGLMDAGRRAKVRSLVQQGGQIQGGRISWKSPARFMSSEIPEVLKFLVDLARDLSSTQEGPVWKRLAHNAEADPVAGVRLWNLLTLQEQFGQLPDTRETSHRALKDPSDWVRLSGARFLDDEALDVLEQLATGASTTPEAAAEALGLLASRLPAERSGPLLLTILKTRTGRVQLEAIASLGRLKDAAAFGPLIVILERSDPDEAAAAAEALGRLGDPRAETALLAATLRGEPELRRRAVSALGGLGTVAAVPALLDLADRRGLDDQTRLLARDAAREIQSRLAGAEAGQLSLADAETGRLSLSAPGEEGSLSFPEPQKGPTGPKHPPRGG